MRLLITSLVTLVLAALFSVCPPVFSDSPFPDTSSVLGPATPFAPCIDDPSTCSLPAATSDRAYGTTTLRNPAAGQALQSASDDPLAGFSRRPLAHFIIPEGGLFLDENYEGRHYGVDYANPDDYLDGLATLIYPIGPGYVTARSDCWQCFVHGDAEGRVQGRMPWNNFGFGSFVLVETPVTPCVSIYTMYAHLQRDWVSLGDYVTPDTPIGLVGSTGFSQEIHLHLEVRYGAPARFWTAAFSQWANLDRWMATLFANPALLVFPQNHPAMLTALTEWVARQPRAPDLP